VIAATPVVLVSDLGQVLLPFETRRAWDALLPHVDLPEAELRSVVGAVLRETGFGAGLVTEEEFYGRVRDRTGLRLSHKEFAIAWSDMFWVDEAVLTLIREAPVEQRYLLSNTNAIHWSYIRQHFGRVLEVFDGLFVSHETGLEKPNRAFYELVIARSGRPAEAHLFIDDIAENVEGPAPPEWMQCSIPVPLPSWRNWKRGGCASGECPFRPPLRVQPVAVVAGTAVRTPDLAGRSAAAGRA
jgi:HAD superfamily hydrolase (TIGR01509 family)